MKLALRHSFHVATLLATTALSAPAFAQYIPPADIPPVHSSTDEFNVDMVTRQIAAQISGSISIGPAGPGGLKYIWSSSNRAGSDINAGIDISGTKYSVYLAGGTTSFTLSGSLGTGTFSNDQGGGETLTYNATTGQYTFTTADGVVLVLGVTPTLPWPVSLTYPAGETLTWNYDSASPWTLRSITSNLGYQLRQTFGSGGSLAGIVLFNMASESCDPHAVSCTLTGSWPTIDFAAHTINGVPAPTWTSQPNSSTGGTTIIASIPMTSSTSRTLVYEVGSDGRIDTVSNGLGTWTYSYPNPYGGGITLKTFRDGTTDRDVRAIMWNSLTGVVTQDIILGGPATGASSQEDDYSYDNFQRVKTHTVDGVLTTYTYDARGNINTAVTVDTNGANPITTSAIYPTTCGNPKTCNKPTSTTDANNNTISYTYDPNSGAIATITSPLVMVASVGNVSPSVTATYAAQNETWKDGTGATVTGSAVYRPTVISQCMTQTSCSATSHPSDEVRTTITYDTENGLQPSTVTKGSNGSASPVLQATTTYHYLAQGDVYSVDGPLTGDTTWFKYGTDRRLAGIIGPDPDVAGSGMPNRAVKITRLYDGSVNTVSIGTATDQSTAALTGMTFLQQVQHHYDAQGHVDKDTTYDNMGVVAGITQYSYAPWGALQCTAVRNNSSTWSSQANACAQTTSGTDLITKSTTDYLGNVLEVRAGYTSDTQAPNLVNAYTQTWLSTQKDGNGNITTYGYDTFNRLNSTCYADSATDCEKITIYDANSNVKTRQLRDGTNITYTYDALNRLLTRALPEGTVSYGYNLLGEMTSVAQGTTTLTSTYDQLGRNLTQTGPQGTVCSTWDLEGRRTQLRYPGSSDCSLTDAFYVNYDYAINGDLQKIRENGATSGVGVLASYIYDALGNRSSVTYGNGATQSYGYDSLERLHTLTSDLEGAAATNDLTNTLTYNLVSQITQLTRSNTKYAWTSAVNANRTYAPNVLNQYNGDASTTFAYDAKGNLSRSGATYYCYNSDNRLTTIGATATCGSPTATLAYDPIGRLSKVTGASTTQFAYDGLKMIGEYDGSNALKARHVFGPSVDEPIASYDASGNRTFLTADERGSIIALTNGSGMVTANNSYDEYGIPQTNASGASVNSGRFQYTGQAWLSEVGMYYYKNRIYSPTLGRFLQTDPSGYADGPNWYAYTHNDPVNGSDPLGLCGRPNEAACQTSWGPASPCVYCNAVGSYGSDGNAIVTSWRTYGLRPWANPADGGGNSCNGGSCWVMPEYGVPSLPGGYSPDYKGVITYRVPLQRQQPQPRCGNGWAAWIADKADKVSLVFGGIATTSGLLGLAAAPTGAGFAGFESVAAVSGLISYGAAGIGAFAHFANGDAVGGILDLGGAAGGYAVGKLAGRALASTRTFGNLSASQARQAALAGNGAGTAAGAAASLYSCH